MLGNPIYAQLPESCGTSIKQIDAAMCADPKYSVAGFEERDDPIFTQALRFGIAFDMFFDDIEPTQAAADRSDPKHPGTILEQCADLKGVDGMRNGEFGVVVNNLNTIPVVFVQSPVETSDPDVSVIVLRRDPG